MSMQYQPPNLIGATNAMVASNPFMDRLTQARSPGSVMVYEYKSLKPKKQLKEIKETWGKTRKHGGTLSLWIVVPTKIRKKKGKKEHGKKKKRERGKGTKEKRKPNREHMNK